MAIRIPKLLIVCVPLFYVASADALQLKSQHAIVVNSDTGAVRLEKNAQTEVPIASLTKLMTAMVVLDSKPDMNEKISINAVDVDAIKHSKSHVPIGTTPARREVLQLALMSSDNRAAAALARTFPGGNVAFIKAVNEKIKILRMMHTRINEPTGLSPANTSSATDLATMAAAASLYPEIVNITTQRSDLISLRSRRVTFHNTNHLVGTNGWNIRLSKTGFTNEAGHCLIMRIHQAGKNATLVLLNAKVGAATRFDALSIRRYLASPAIVQSRVLTAQHGAHRHEMLWMPPCPRARKLER